MRPSVRIIFTLAVATMIVACQREAGTPHDWNRDREGASPQSSILDPQSASDATRVALTHAKAHFAKRIERVTDRVHVAIGYALGNSILVAVDGGKVIFDTTESLAAAREIRSRFDEIAPGPVLAVIYTHTHPDHILGASAFADADTPIFATARAPHDLSHQFGSVSTALRMRGAHQFGEGLPEKLMVSNAIGARLRLDDGPVPPVLYPTKTFEGETRFEIGGVTFELMAAPGETHDQLFVWLPGERVLLPGDNIYAAFPNLYAPRGVPPRPVREWIASLDAMRARAPEYLVPSHTSPISGADSVMKTLTAYRDAIAHVHNSVVNMANDGATPDEMAVAIRLPTHLAAHPWLQEVYGTVAWSVRGVYAGYFGWFDGRAQNLSPLSPRRRADILVPLAGRDRIVARANELAGEGDRQAALELASMLLDTNAGDDEARELASRMMEEIGRATPNMNARGYYLTSAAELAGAWAPPPRPVIAPETIAQVPLATIIGTFPERLTDKAVGADFVLGIDISNTGESYTFVLRKGVGEVAPRRAESPDLRIVATERDFKEFLLTPLGAATNLLTGDVKIEGGVKNLARFNSLLKKP